MFTIIIIILVLATIGHAIDEVAQYKMKYSIIENEKNTAKLLKLEQEKQALLMKQIEEEKTRKLQEELEQVKKENESKS